MNFSQRIERILTEKTLTRRRKVAKFFYLCAFA